MTTIAQIVKNVKSMLWEDALRLGRTSGFVQRLRKLDGRSFAQTLIFGALDEPELSYSDLSEDGTANGVTVSAQGWAQRFDAAAAEFMRQVLDAAVGRVLQGYDPGTMPILGRFNGVFLYDSSVISLPKELHDEWPGVGGSAGDTAALKLQVRLDYSSGQLDGPALQTGRTHDRQSPYTYADEPVGSLVLYDLGYFNLDDMQARHQRGQYVVSRYKQGIVVCDLDGTRLSLLAELGTAADFALDRRVLVGARHQIPMRLLAVRVPQEVAEQRRHRLYEYARKKQTELRSETLKLTNWTLVLTNAPQQVLSLTEVLTLLHVRWQVELLFKLWKSYVRVDEWRSRNVHRILCELYAKLAGVVILQWIFMLDWHKHADMSLFKAAHVVQKFALALSVALNDTTDALIEKLLLIVLQMIESCCHTNHRKGRPATFQLLLALQPEALS